MYESGEGASMTRGFCSECGTPIYRKFEWRLKRTRLPFADVIDMWPPIEHEATLVAEVVQQVVYMATEMGPEICHCPHCGVRIRGAEVC